MACNERKLSIAKGFLYLKKNSLILIVYDEICRKYIGFVEEEEWCIFQVSFLNIFIALKIINN